jgi:chromosomal replication initiation ATPase DnaA
MSNNEELGALLKNIQQGLKMYSVTELNEAIVKALGDKNSKAESIKYVLTIVCNEYNISEYALKNMKKRGLITQAKEISYCLLYYNLGLKIREISNDIFGNCHTSVAIGIKKYNESDIFHPTDKEFIEKYDRLKAKLIKFIEKDKNKLV